MNKTLTLEQALDKLETLSQRMEDSSRSLDAAMTDFEEGVKLVHYCQTLLEDYKKRITVLKNENGTIREVDEVTEDE